MMMLGYFLIKGQAVLIIFNDFSRGIFSYFEEKPTGFLDLLKAIKKDMGNDFSNDLEDKILETIQIFDQKGIISPL